MLLVRAGDLDSLKLYGRRCVDLVWWLENAAQRGVHTTVLVQGDTLGGGLESVLPFHKVIFERSAQAGFPEVLFNLFPGMGAWNFTIRKAGFAVANEMILSGRLYTADQLLPPQPGRPGGRRRRRRSGDRARGAHRSTRGCAARWRRCRRSAIAAPITYESLLAIVDHWAETALTLTDRDLRLMERLARAQVRKAGGGDEGAVEEIKRIELDTAWGEERTGITEWGDDRTGITALERRLEVGRCAGLQPGRQQLAQLAARVGLGQVAVHAGRAARARRPRRRRWRSARRSARAAGRAGLRARGSARVAT